MNRPAKATCHNRRSAVPGRWFAWPTLVICLSARPALANKQRAGQPLESEDPRQQAAQQVLARVSGTIVDVKGTNVSGALVKLSRGDGFQTQEIMPDADGSFSFTDVCPGAFQLTVSSAGFMTRVVSGTVGSGESAVLPAIILTVATANTAVEVVAPRVEVAEDEIKAEEKQRLLGVIPNFYVSYIPNAAPLDAKQKFELAWKSTIDPVTFALTGALAGIEQADNALNGYGQGAQGYGKRFGAAYADTVTGTFIGGALLPTLLRQDPRYFYKGRGSIRSRIFYAIATSVICKGDNQRWQPDYSGVIGSLAAGAISNAYYPASDRSGVALTFENTAIGIGETAVANILQEFVVRKLTPNLPKSNPAKP